MTSTFSKSPMSGTLISISFAMRVAPGQGKVEGRREKTSLPNFCLLASAFFLQYEIAALGEHCGEEARAARCRRAVDDAMVVGRRQRQHHARPEFRAVPHR